jgi:hypothetical protein
MSILEASDSDPVLNVRIRIRNTWFTFLSLLTAVFENTNILNKFKYLIVDNRWFRGLQYICADMCHISDSSQI